MLVLRQGGSLPPRCVKCNAPAELPIKARRVYWHHPALYILAVINVLLYALVGLIVRKQAMVPAGLCAEHRKRRSMGLTVGWVGSLLGLVLGIALVRGDNCGLAMLAVLLFVGSIVAGMILSRVVYPDRIDKDFVRLKGCGESFLASLPEFHG
ncbi:MAG TPA: hypothetical protein VJ600_07900 [Holophagaceae bacterium]|nr:hypothetical protein [Holophagaceae bacterium]